MKSRKKVLFIVSIFIVNVISLSGLQINLAFPSPSKPSYSIIEENTEFIFIPRLVNGSSIQESNNSVGSGSSVDISPPSFDIGESNDTHLWVIDPTNQTDGYYIEMGSGYQELNSSRGQTNRHWYNETSNEYTFGSDCLVNKTGIIEGSDWITQEEYPNRFIVRLMNGSIYTFETVFEINAFYSVIDNSTVWGVGYESFEGVMGFYLNFQDNNWGHAQYLYWPRLKNGQISSYNQPLYAFYPHLYAKFNDVWYDKILNDRSLYTEPYQNPRNTLGFFNDSDTFGVYFTTNDISILSSTWDFVHGFKFNFTDQQYHFITRFQCQDRNFQDLGMGYEITSSPQSDGTPYQPDRFRLINDTHQVEVNITQAWQADAYLEDYYSQVEIISQSNESFIFTFSDMEQTGFTQKYLNLHDQQMPDESIRKTLQAGMYGYGSYSQGNWIEIDPDVGPLYPADDDHDIYRQVLPSVSWSDFGDTINVGKYYDGTQYSYDAFTMWDTGINVAIATDGVSVADCQLYPKSNYIEASEGINARVYNIVGSGDGDGSNTALESSQSYVLGTNNLQTAVLINPATGGYRQLDTTKMEATLDYWANNRGSSENYISFQWEQYGTDNGEASDYLVIYDFSKGAGYKEKLSFTYALPNTAPTASYLSGADTVQYARNAYSFATRHTDVDGRDTIQYAYGSVGDANNDIEFRCDPNSGATPTVTVVAGSGYLIGETATSARGGTGDNWDMTWTYTIDWDWDHDDSQVIDYFAYTTDDSAANSGWDQEDLNYNYENELVVQTLDFALSDSAYSDDGDTDLNLNEWFRGGVGIRGAGTVRYEGASSVSPPDSIVNAQLWTDGTDREDSYDVAVVSGAFTTPYWTTVSTVGIDDTYALDVTLQNFPTGGSEGANGAAGFNTKRDNEVPTTSFTSIVENAPHTYIYYQGSGQTVFFSDLMDTTDQLCTITVSGDDSSGSGVKDYSWSAWDDDGATYTTASRQYSTDSTETSGSITSACRDNVNNVDASPITITMTEDTTVPTMTAIVVTGDGTVEGYEDWDQNGGGFLINPSARSDGSGSGVNTVWYEVTNTPPDAYNSNDDPYTYPVDVGADGSYTFYAMVVDNVGNEGAVVQDNGYVDETGPLIETTEFTNEDYDDGTDCWFDQGDIATANFDIPFTETNLYSIVVTATGGLSPTDWSAGGSPFTSTISITGKDDMGAQNISITVTDKSGRTDTDYLGDNAIALDNTAPSGYSIALDVDSATIGYQPNTSYYDDDSVDFTVGGTASDTGSGLQTNCYGFQYDSGGYSWQSGTNKQYTSVSEANHTIDLKVIDNVGNEGTIYSDWVIVDDDAPSGFTLSWEHVSYNYAYLSGTDLYFNSGEDYYFQVTVLNDGEINNSAFWKIEWDKNSVFETGENDTSGLPDTEDFNYYEDSSGTFLIRVINNAGNYQSFSYTAIEDVTAPTTTFSSITENDPHTYIYATGQTVYFSDLMEDTDQLFTVVVTANDGGSGLYGVRMSLWDDETDAYDTNSPYSRQYSTDSSETSGSITLTAYDRVGNCDASPITITMQEDTAGPTVTQSGESESSEYLHSDYGTAAQGCYGSQMGTGIAYTVSGTASDNYAGVLSLTDDTDFGDNPSNGGSPTSWSFEYTIDADDNGDVTITYTAIDNVGNTDTDIYDFYEDNTAPTVGTLNVVLTADTDSDGGNDINPQSGYYDDDSVSVDRSGTPTDTGSGLPALRYSYKYDGGSYDSWVSGMDTIYSVPDGAQTMYVRVRDNVGNIVSELDSVAVHVELNTPTQDNPIYEEISQGEYLYNPTATYLYYTDHQAVFNLTGTISTHGGSGYYGIRFTDAFDLGDNTTDTSSPYEWQYEVNVADTDTVLYLILYNNAGNSHQITVTLDKDTTDPIGTFALFQDSQACVSNYYHTTSPYTNASASDSGSGVPADCYSYKFRIFSWSDWTAEDDYPWSLPTFDQYNSSLYLKIRDNVGNINDTFTDWVFCDTIVSVLDLLTLNETYAPNWYDQSVSTVAWIHIEWNETYVYHVNITISGSLTSSDDLSPSGGESDFYTTITGASDGAYTITITIYDKAGNTDTSFTIDESPIQLLSGMSVEAHIIDFWFFYYRSDGKGLDWKDFNTTYVLDENHQEYTEVLFLGGLYGYRRFNDTSSIRIITRDYFQEVVYNQSFALPSSGVVNIQLTVFTFKVASTYNGIINMTIERTSGLGSYDEQIMPFELFRWDLYNTTYNITGIVHMSSTYATDDNNNILNDYQIDLSSNDVAIFINALDNQICYINIIDQSNNYLEPKAFKIWLNSTRIYADSFLWTDTTTSKNITITDLFDNLLYQNVAESYSKFLDVILTLYSVKIHNIQFNPVHVNISRGSRYFSEWVFSFEVLKYYFEADNYTFMFLFGAVDDDFQVGYNATVTSFTYNIDIDTGVMITGRTLDDIYININGLYTAVGNLPTEPADPNIEIEVDLQEIIDKLEKRIDELEKKLMRETTREVSFWGSLTTFCILLAVGIALLALFREKEYQKLKKFIKEKGEEFLEFLEDKSGDYHG